MYEYKYEYKILFFRSLSNHGKLQYWHVENTLDKVLGNLEAYAIQHSHCFAFIFYFAFFRRPNRAAASGARTQPRRSSLQTQAGAAPAHTPTALHKAAPKSSNLKTTNRAER